MNKTIYKGLCGLQFTVYFNTNIKQWCWNDQSGYGFTNESLDYIMDYLKEVKLIKINN